MGKGKEGGRNKGTLTVGGARASGGGGGGGKMTDVGRYESQMEQRMGGGGTQKHE